MNISEDILRMMEARDVVDQKFIEYSRPQTLHGNFESLSHLALIGGRLDSIIKRKLAQERDAQRRLK